MRLDVFKCWEDIGTDIGELIVHCAESLSVHGMG